jgi:flagellar hook-length control protein FliK
LNGNGAEAKGQVPASQLAALATAASPGETLALPAFAAQLQGLTQGVPDPGSVSGETGPVYRPFSPEIQESLWTQLQSGITSNLGQEESQVTISLNPPDMGQIQISLQLNGQELAVTAMASRPEVAAMANLQMLQLIQAIAQQGIVHTQFQVHVRDQPAGQIAPVAAGPRTKGGEPGGSSSTSSRRRSAEVDRFV